MTNALASIARRIVSAFRPRKQVESIVVPTVFDPFAPTGDVMAVAISAADRARFQINDMMFKGAEVNRYPHDIWQS